MSAPSRKFITYLYEIVDMKKWSERNPLKTPDTDGLHVMGISCADLMGVTNKIEEIVNSDKSDDEKLSHIKTILDGRFP